MNMQKLCECGCGAAVRRRFAPGHNMHLRKPPPCSVPQCDRPSRRRGYCTMHFERVQRHGTTDLPPKPTTEERFWSKVDKYGPVTAHAHGRCWIWTAALNNRGYGQFYTGTRHE